MKTEEPDAYRQRRLERLDSLKRCVTLEELALNIWTPKQEEYMGDRSMYRNPFKEWIHSYKEGTTPSNWHGYKTPRQLAEGIWKPFLDRPDDYGWFSDLRDALVEWIEKYRES